MIGALIEMSKTSILVPFNIQYAIPAVKMCSKNESQTLNKMINNK